VDRNDRRKETFCLNNVTVCFNNVGFVVNSNKRTGVILKEKQKAYIRNWGNQSHFFKLAKIANQNRKKNIPCPEKKK